jgi:autotransporter translocation and assembly factor TamB
MRDNLKTITVDGSYSLGTDHAITFDVELDKLRVNLFNPYADDIFDDLRGLATGALNIRGTTKKPLLNGKLKFQKTSFGIDYLKTRYNFTDDIEVINNNVYFNDLVITDGYANNGTVSGSIRSNYLKDFVFDLTIRSDKLLCLNTKQTDNETFYGTAYASDLVFRLTGPTTNLLMDISAGTAENTVVSIPLSENRQLSEYDFINVVYKGQTAEETTEDIKNTARTNPGLQLNLDLQVTPDAEVQIIFDPKLGDIIKGKGTGDLDMRINTNGEFVMYGTYTIEQGDYLFTLQNFINKKLTIEEGGTIRWSGDPFDATINIVATYRVKTHPLTSSWPLAKRFR